MKAAASLTSSRCFGASGRIDQLSSLLDRVDEVRVFEAAVGKQIDGAAEEALEGFKQPEVLVGDRHKIDRPEFDKKVEVAVRSEVSCCRRPEYVEPPDVKSKAEFGEGLAIRFNDSMHRGVGWSLFYLASCVALLGVGGVVVV